VTRTALVTGANRGIGLEVCRQLLALDHRVVLAARDEARLEEVARGLAGRGLAIPTDVTDGAAVGALVERTAAALGRVDIVINNAGVGLAAPVADLSFEDFQRVLSVDLFGPLALTQAALPHMRRRGRGQLIYVSSVVGLRALPYLGGYAAAKAALDRLSAVLAAEEPDVRVYAVDPGDMRTDMHQAAFPGEDIGDRPLPETRVPGFVALLEGDFASGRYEAAKLAAELATEATV
jgi:NAD(P)-dependent dehydrogenase (short-subunit alcohol dehydrogenase family)